MKIYTHKNTALSVVNKLKTEINFNLFPSNIIINYENSWSSMFIESRSIFDKESYNKFLKMLKLLGNNSYYMCSAYANEFNWYKYEKQHLKNKKTKIYRCPVIEVSTSLNFDIFYDKIETEFGYSYVESFIVDVDLNWVFHFIPNKDIMVLYYKNIFSKKIEGIYYNESLKTLAELKEVSEDEFSDKEYSFIEKQWFEKDTKD